MPVAPNRRSIQLSVLLIGLSHQLAFNYASYFDKFSAYFMNFSNHSSRYWEYQVLYADSAGLPAAVCNFYAVVIFCCTQAVQVIKNPGKYPLLCHLYCMLLTRAQADKYFLATFLQNRGVRSIRKRYPTMQVRGRRGTSSHPTSDHIPGPSTTVD